MTIEINVEGLSFSYDSRNRALDNVSFHVEGERIGIVGQNGSGKTTLLSILMGFLKPDEGNVTINGIIPSRERGRILKVFAPSFEKGRLPYRMKVKELVELLGKVTGDPSGVRELAEDIGISTFMDKRVYGLSSGQEQLVWIFNALADQNRIPALDEPFVHLDIHAYRRVVKALKERFDSYILISHVPEDVELLTESLVVLEMGKVRWYGQLSGLEPAYEVFVPSGANVDLPGVLVDFGNVLVCKCSPELLDSMMKDGKILGYKRAGVRLLYAQVLD
ncbi:hypothetical protein A3L09_07040 [Thermococcus profundus]|uniref:ABC transporter domain-containing protein n=1 Tax=Thermococcus profundus TaxID=49899 RepID=A0A2Z2MM96_THEPR|nr:ABC transporter ATP-binding protein [Thermococcus profundus]ASJ03028.1 hypothetical protein A3L09_07040 [Thermococcus profundus]